MGASEAMQKMKSLTLEAGSRGGAEILEDLFSKRWKRLNVFGENTIVQLYTDYSRHSDSH